MRFEWPDCKRCCLCVPLRHGILIFGYLNLMFSIFNLSIIVDEIMHASKSTRNTIFVFRGVTVYTHMWFPCLIFGLEVIFNLLLLVGAHRKNVRIIRAYYYYGIMTTVAAFLTFIVARHFSKWQSWYPDSFDICVVFSGFALQCYLLLLIRAELNKLRYQGGQFRYVNHMAEVVVDPFPPGECGSPL